MRERERSEYGSDHGGLLNLDLREGWGRRVMSVEEIYREGGKSPSWA